MSLDLYKLVEAPPGMEAALAAKQQGRRVPLHPQVLEARAQARQGVQGYREYWRQAQYQRW